MDLSTPSASGWSSIAPTVAYNNFTDLPVVYNGSYYIMVTYRYPVGGCSGFPNISDLLVVYNGSSFPSSPGGSR
jgi:hypothetical protein